jgi:hypothetical protein
MGQWDNAGQGAFGGAATGASIGSVIPGLGTGAGALIGAGLGGLAGYLGGQGSAGYEDQLRNLANKYGNRAAPQMQQAQNSAFRQNQAGLISQLEAMARGEGPSAARLQMREAMDRQAAAQASNAAGAGGRGVNAGAAALMAGNNTAALQAQNAQQTGIMRAQEQLGAINQLGNVINQGRGADEGTSQFNAGQYNQAQMNQQQLNQMGQLQALQMAMGGAGNSLGTALMAGGASTLPGLMKMLQDNKNKGNGNGNGGGGGGSPDGSDYGTDY